MTVEEKIALLESKIQRLENTVQYRDSIIPAHVPSFSEGRINEEHLIYVGDKPRLYRKGYNGWHFIDLYKHNQEYDQTPELGHRHRYRFIKIAATTTNHAVPILGYADAYENYYVIKRSYKILSIFATVHNDNSTLVPSSNVASYAVKFGHDSDKIIIAPNSYDLLWIDARYLGSAWTFTVGAVTLNYTSNSGDEIRITVEIEDI